MSMRSLVIFTVSLLPSMVSAKNLLEIEQYLPKKTTVTSVMDFKMDQSDQIAQAVKGIDLSSVSHRLQGFGMGSVTVEPGDLRDTQELIEKEKIQLTVEKLGEGKIRLLTDPVSVVHNTIINQQTGELKTGNGMTLTNFNELSVNNIPAIGKWEGVRWATDPMSFASKGFSGMSFSSVSFSIGRATNDNERKNTIHFQSVSVRGTSYDQEQLLLFFE